MACGNRYMKRLICSFNTKWKFSQWLVLNKSNKYSQRTRVWRDLKRKVRK